MKPKSYATKQFAKCFLFFMVLMQCAVHGQETTVDFGLDNSFHNQLFFSRYLLNPTFSLVRENKSHLNVLVRNQYAGFEDNPQDYYLGFSNQLNENTAVGLGVNGRWKGIIQEFGILANYATRVRLGSNTQLTFGTNISYSKRGLDRNGIIVNEEDPALDNLVKENNLTIQPAFTVSLGRFDFGVYARDLLKYNHTTNNLSTNLGLSDMSFFSQYEFNFRARHGLLENARFLPLLEWGKNQTDGWYYRGSALLDFPNYGWLQMSINDVYGLSYGMGFNLGKRLSLGYLLEKELNDSGSNLGWNHELLLGYTFKDTKSSNTSKKDFASSADARVDEVVRNYEEQLLQLKEEKKSGHDFKQDDLAYQNRLILDELLLRQDSIEEARKADLEKRFGMLVRLLRNEAKQGVGGNAKTNETTATSVSATKRPLPKDIKSNTLEKVDLKYLTPIKTKKFRDIPGVATGYYLIANVYRNQKYLNAFVQELEADGLSPKKFYNKNNGLHYLYLAKLDREDEARSLIRSNINHTYLGEVWLMEVYHSNLNGGNQISLN